MYNDAVPPVQYIHKGRNAMQDKKPSIYDVAKASGVSIATVSRVMGGKCASESAKQKVNAAIAALSYRPCGPNRVQSSGSAPLYLLAVTDLQNPYYTALCAGAEAEARKNGCGLQLLCTGPADAINVPAIRSAFSQPLSGAVIAGTIIETPDTIPELKELLISLTERVPVVTIGPTPEWMKCTSITSDLSLSVRKSIAHLAALGHRRIAFIGGSPNVRSATVRELAFAAEMKHLGLPAIASSYNESGFTPRDGEICVTKLFSRLPEDEQPTALIAINDLVALGAMRQLHRMGLRIPEDVAIVGCDNQFFSSYLNPPLTTVDLHPYEHGVFAIGELVSSHNNGERLSFSQMRECSLIVRESCGAALGLKDRP